MERAQSVRPPRPLRLLAGWVLAGLVAALVALIFAAILQVGLGAQPSARPPDVLHLLRMTVIQAGLSTILSLAAGVALAWALDRLRFWGREWLVGLFASAIVTPGLVIAFGLLAVWGRNGWVAGVLEAGWGVSFGGSIFGLWGIIAAHLVLDAAFAARVLLGRLEAIPERRLKTGQSLGLSAWRRFVLIDWPALAPSLPGVGAVIFLLAFTSFPIVLVLGGGPANQTLEVAIYSAVRVDFDLVGAVILALVQVSVCGAVIILSSSIASLPASLAAGPRRHWRDAWPARLLQWTVLLVASIGFVSPLMAVLADGLTEGLPLLLGRPSFWAALTTSLVIASLSAVLALGLALVLAMARAAAKGEVARTALGLPGFVYLAVPAVVLSLGFFLFVRALGVQPGLAAPFVVVLANALLTLPFAQSALGPPLDAIAQREGKLIRSLGLSGLRQFAAVEWPLIGRDVGVVLALGFCFSLGDLGVIALFGTGDFTTLPLLMFRALGAYRTNDAAAIAALMLLLCLAAFVLLPRLTERLSRA